MRQSSIPLKDILSGGDINFVRGNVVALDRQSKSIKLESGAKIEYDKLVLSLGVVTNYFNIQGLGEYSYGIKSIEEVKRFKNHLHNLICDERKPDLNYLIVGAGPSGIELAGVLPDYLRQIMRNHNLRAKKVSVKIIEAAPRLLPRSHPAISKAVARRLEKLGVELLLSQSVDGETAESLLVGGKPIKSRTVVWTAGTANNPFFENNGFALNDRGKVMVDDHLKTEKDIYVIGDNAATLHSGLAQTAVYDGHYVAGDIEATWHDNEGAPYRPRYPATVIPVGPGWAAFEYKKLWLVGRLGWMVRQAADWIGFHDLEPWWKASEQWVTEFGEEESCSVCSQRKD